MNQDRINQQLIRYDCMEARLEQARNELTPLESLYVERIIEYRRSQMKLLADANRCRGKEAATKAYLAQQLGAAAAAYENNISKEVYNAVDSGD